MRAWVLTGLLALLADRCSATPQDVWTDVEDGVHEHRNSRTLTGSGSGSGDSSVGSASPTPSPTASPTPSPTPFVPPTIARASFVLQGSNPTPGLLNRSAVLEFEARGNHAGTEMLVLTLPSAAALGVRFGWRLKPVRAAFVSPKLFAGRAVGALVTRDAGGALELRLAVSGLDLDFAWHANQTYGINVMGLHTPSGAVDAHNATLRSFTAYGNWSLPTPPPTPLPALPAAGTTQLVSFGAVAVPKVAEGPFVGMPTFDVAKGTPGSSTDATVSFTPTGNVPAQGIVVLSAKPLSSVQMGWDFETPSVSFAAPSAASAAPNATVGNSPLGGRYLELTLLNPIVGGAAVVLTISQVRTPSGVVSKSPNAFTLQTFDQHGAARAIDASDLAADATVAGKLQLISMVWPTAVPNMMGNATLAFTATGVVPIGGHIVLTWPTAWGSAYPGLTKGWGADGPTATFLGAAAGNSSATAHVNVVEHALHVVITGAPLVEGRVQQLLIGNLKTPGYMYCAENACGPVTVALRTMDNVSALIDGNATVEAPKIDKATFAGKLTWDSAIDTPGVTDSVRVEFSTLGALPKETTITMELPTTQAWRMPKTPVVHFLAPHRLVLASGQWEPATRLLTISTHVQGLPQLSDVTLVLEGVTTPASVVGAANVIMSALHPENNTVVIADASLQTDSFSAGALHGLKLFDTLLDTPVVTTPATVSYLSTGALESGGSIDLIFPAIGWSMPSAPQIVFLNPVGLGSNAAWNATKRELHVTISGASIPQQTAVRMQVKGVVNPPSIRPMSSMNVTAKTAGGGIIDGPTSLSTNPIVAGALKGDLKWSHNGTGTPGHEDFASFHFIPQSGVPAGSQIRLELPPVGWKMAAVPSIEFIEPVPANGSAAFVASGSWNSSTHVLSITTGGQDITGNSSVTLVVHNVTTPHESIGAHTFNITVLGSDGLVIDGPEVLTAAPIQVGALRDTKFQLSTSTPGVRSFANVEFVTQSPVAVGGHITLMLPVADGWDFTAGTWKDLDNETTICTDVKKCDGRNNDTWCPKATAKERCEADSACMGIYDISKNQDQWKICTSNRIQPAGETGHGVMLLTRTPCSFTSPANVTEGNSVWNQSAGTLRITTAGAPIMGNAPVNFTITGIKTPPVVTASKKAALMTSTATGGIVDGPSDVLIGAVTAGVLGGAAVNTTWTVQKPTPGTRSTASVPLHFAGELPTGGTVQIKLPAQGWSLPPAPTVRLQRVTNGTVNKTAVEAVWTAGSSILSVLIKGAAIPAGSAATLSIEDVLTPQSERPATSGTVTTMIATGPHMGIIDGANMNLAVASTGAGALHGALSFAVEASRPGVTGEARITCNTSGAIATGGKIKITLPDSWTMVPVPQVELVGSGAATGAWNATTNMLVVTLGGAILPVGRMVLKISDVTTPLVATAQSNATTIVTIAPDGGVIDGSANLSIAAVEAAVATVEDLKQAEELVLSIGCTLGGFTPATFTPVVRENVRLGFADSLNVSSSEVEIISVAFGSSSSARRRLGGLDSSAMSDSRKLVGFAPAALDSSPDAWLMDEEPEHSSMYRMRNLVGSSGSGGGGAAVLASSVAITFGVLSSNFSELAAISAASKSSNFSSKLVTSMKAVGLSISVVDIAIDNVALFAVAAGGSQVNWVPAVNTPGKQGPLQVSFRATGKVLPGSSLVFSLPLHHASQFGWGSAIVVKFTSPPFLAGAAGWNASTSKLAILLSNATIDASAWVNFTVQAHSTPPFVVSKEVMAFSVVSKYNTPQQQMIDGPRMVSLASVHAGALGGLKQFATTVVTPGRPCLATIKFSVNGSVPKDGQITVDMPKDRWIFEASPTVSVVQPASMAATSTWNVIAERLTITLTGALAVSQQSAVELVVAGIETPHSVRPETVANVTTRTANGMVIDGPTTIAVNEIIAGNLRGNLYWDTALDAPNHTSPVEVSFITHSPVPSNGSVQLLLPCDGWDMPQQPHVEFLSPHSNVSVLTNWSACSNKLSIKLTTEPLPANATVRFMVAHVKNPPKIVPESNATLFTLGPNGKQVDAPETIAVNKIVIPQFTTNWVAKPASFALSSTPMAPIVIDVRNSSGKGHLTGSHTDYGVVSCKLRALLVDDTLLTESESDAILHGHTEAELIGGRATFSGIRIQQKMHTAVQLAAACDGHGGIFPAVNSNLTVQNLTLDFLTPTPRYIIASSPAVIEPIAKPVRIAIRNHSGAIMTDDNTTSCILRVVANSTAALLSPSLAKMQRGVATFRSVAVDAPFGVDIAFRVRCTRTVPAPEEFIAPIQNEATIQNVTIGFLVRPPQYLVGSSRGMIEPIANPVRVAIRNHTGSIMTNDNSTTCVLAAAADTSLVNSSIASNAAVVARLLTPSNAKMVAGVAIFEDVAVEAPLGTNVIFTAQCTRNMFGAEQRLVPIHSPSMVQNLSASWHAIPAYTLADGPIAPHLQIAVSNHTGGSYGYLSNFSARVRCTVHVVGASVPLYSVALLGRTSAIVVEGVAHFAGLVLHAPIDTNVTLRAICKGSEAIPSVDHQIRVGNIIVNWDMAPPSHVYTSASEYEFSGNLWPIPPVVVSIRDVSNNNSVIAVDNSTRCEATVHRKDGAVAVAVPQLLLVQRAIVVVRDGIANFTALAFSANMGSEVALKISCFWGGAGEGQVMPQPLVSLQRSIAVRNLTVAWQDSNIPAMVQSDAVQNWFKVQIENSTGVVHAIPGPPIHCDISIDYAYDPDPDVAGIVIVDGKITNDYIAKGGTRAKAPALKGLVRTTLNAGAGSFDPVSVTAKLGTDVRLKILCTATVVLPPLYTSTIKVGNVAAQFRNPLPSKVYASKTGVMNFIGAVDGTNDNFPSIQIIDTSENKTDTNDQATLCEAISKNSSRWSLLGDGVTATAINGVITFRKLSISAANLGSLGDDRDGGNPGAWGTAVIRFICYAAGQKNDENKMSPIEATVGFHQLVVVVKAETPYRVDTLERQYQAIAGEIIGGQLGATVMAVHIMNAAEYATNASATALNKAVFSSATCTFSFAGTAVKASGESANNALISGGEVEIRPKADSEANEFVFKDLTLGGSGVIGTNQSVHIQCTGGTPLPLMKRHLTVKACDVGESPGALLCEACPVTAFSVDGITCLTCPSKSTNNATSTFGATGCICEKGYFAAADPLYQIESVAARTGLYSVKDENDMAASLNLPLGVKKENSMPTAANKYNREIEPSNMVCMPCPTGGNCQQIGTTFDSLTSLPGFWQVKSFYRNDTSKKGKGAVPNFEVEFKYEKCPEVEANCVSYDTGTLLGNQTVCSTCVGGDSQMGFPATLSEFAGGCQPNHGGPMCAHCTSKLFFKGGDGLCAACPGGGGNNDFSGNTIYYFALTLIILAILVVSFARKIVKEKARQFEEYKEAQMNTMMHKAGMSDEDIDEAGGIVMKFKIMISLFQVLSQFTANFPQVNWPFEFKDFTADLKIFNFDFFDTKAVGCAAQTGFYETFIMQITIPPVICVLVYIAHKTAKLLDMQTFSNPAVVPKYILFVLFFIYPGTSNTILKMLRCDTLHDSSQYLGADYRIRCDSTEQVDIFLGSSTISYPDARGLAIFMIFVYPIGVPLLFISVLYKNKAVLYDPNGPLDVWGNPTEPDEALALKYGQLYTAYDPKRWYWEVIELGRKLILVGLICFIMPDTPTQLAVGCILSLVFITLYAKFSPYKADDDDNLQLCCQLAIFMSYFSALLLTVQDPQVKAEGGTFAFILMFVNIMPMVVGVGVVIKVAVLPIATVVHRIWRRQHGWKDMTKSNALRLEDLLVCHIVSCDNLRKKREGEVQGVHVQGFWNGEVMGKTKSEKKEYYNPRLDDKRIKCLFPKDVAGCTLKLVVNHETGAGIISFLGQIELSDRDLVDLPTEPSPYTLKPRVGQSASQVSGTVMLSFITTNIGWQKAKELQKIGKLVGRRNSTLSAAEQLDVSKTAGKRELLSLHNLFLQVNGADRLLKHDAGSHAMVDPYCTVFWNQEEILRTPVITHSASPVWDAQVIDLPLSKLTIDLFDHDMLTSDTFLGHVQVEGDALENPLRGVQERSLSKKWLGKSNTKQKGVQGVLELEITVMKSLQIEVCSASGLAKTNTFHEGSDTFCKVFWNDELMHETRTVKRSCEPLWEQEVVRVMVRGDVEEGAGNPKDRTKMKRVRTWRDSELCIEVWGSGHFLGEVNFKGEQLNTLPFAGKQYDLIKKSTVDSGKGYLKDAKTGKRSKVQQKYVDGKGQLFLKFAPIDVLQLQLMSAHDLAKVDLIGSCDPYYVISYNGTELGRSTPLKRTRTPVWADAVYIMPLQEVRFVLRDHDGFGLGRKKNDFLGQSILRSNYAGNFNTGHMDLPLRPPGEGEMTAVQGHISVEVDMLVKLHVQIVDCTALHEVDDRAPRSFYVVALWDGQEVGRTGVQKGALNPLWSDEFVETHVPSTAPDSGASWQADSGHKTQKELTLQVWNKKSGLSSLRGDAFHGQVVLPVDEIRAHDYLKYELIRMAAHDHDQELVGGALGIQVHIDGKGILEHGHVRVGAQREEGHFSITDVLSPIPKNPLAQIAQEVAGTGAGKLGRKRAKRDVEAALQDNAKNPDQMLPVLRKDALLVAGAARRATMIDDEENATSDRIVSRSTVKSPLRTGQLSEGTPAGVEIFRVSGGTARSAGLSSHSGNPDSPFGQIRGTKQRPSMKGAALQIQGALDILKRRGTGTGGSAKGLTGGNSMGVMRRGMPAALPVSRSGDVMNPLGRQVMVPMTMAFDQWLREHKLDSVKAELGKSGISDMEDLSELEQSDLQHLEISHFHQKRLARVLFYPDQERALRDAQERQRQKEQDDQRKGDMLEQERQDAENPLGLESTHDFVGHSHAMKVKRRPSEPDDEPRSRSGSSAGGPAGGRATRAEHLNL